MSKSRSVSRSAPGRTISVDASYAQELVEFWTRKYEQVKEELEQIKDTSVAASSSPSSSSCDNDDERESGPSSATENEGESEADALRACNEDLRNKLALSEEHRLALVEQIQPLLAQNAALALEADVSRQQMINAMYPAVAFFPAGANPSTFRSSLQALSQRLSAEIPEGHRSVLTSLTQTRQSTQSTSTLSSICFVPRPPGCLPLRVTECGQHGYWFSPATVYPEDLEFELVVEGKADEWTYLGRYRSVHLPGGEMRLPEWLALDDETKATHCMKVAAQGFELDAAAPALSTAATELRRRYESSQAAVPCFTLVCTGFTLQMQAALHYATRTGKRKLDGQAGGKRVKRETK